MSYRGLGNGGEGRPPAMAMELARQSSIYSLTLDEFQHTVGGFGKDFGSMNMDEFLKSIWIAEETQAMAMASAVSFGDTSAAAAASGPMVATTGLQRQGSLTLPRTISLKTVDEVWRDIARGETTAATNTNTNDQKSWQTSASTYGEMTLEEFLGKAGVIREDAPAVVPRNESASVDGGVFGGFPVASTSDNGAGGLGLGFPSPAATGNGVVEVEKAGVNLQHQQQQQARYKAAAPAAVQLVSSIEVGKGVGDGRNGSIGDAVASMGRGGFAGGGNNAKAPAVGGSPVSNGDLPSLSPTSCMFNTGRKQGSMEKAVERRQKRMIKNRESAARSRARKQAYTLELEAEVAKLKEQNQELMTKQAKILEMQKKQVSRERYLEAVMHTYQRDLLCRASLLCHQLTAICWKLLPNNPCLKKLYWTRLISRKDRKNGN